MANDVNFNLQSFLSEMRGEMHDGFARLDATSTKVREDLVMHELEDVKFAEETKGQLASLHRLQDNVKWTLRAALGAAISGGVLLIINLIVSHWK